MKGIPDKGIPLANTDRLRGQDAAVKLGTSKVINAVCGFRAMTLYRELAGTWGGDGFYAQEQKRVPKGTPFWLAIEIQYGNKSGKPNLKACPSNEAPLPSPLKTSACMAWWNVRRIGPSRDRPSVPNRRAECIQTKLIRLIGTGEKVGDLAVDLSPPMVSLEPCKTVTLTARVTRANLRGNEVLVPLRWVYSSPNGLKQLPTLTGGPGGPEESRTFLAAQPGTHTVATHYLGNDPEARNSTDIAEIKVLSVAPKTFILEPTTPPVLTVGDRLPLKVEVRFGQKHACIPPPSLGQGLTLTASGGTIEGTTFVATTPGTAKLVARYKDPASSLSLDRELAVRIVDRSSLVLSVKSDKTEIGPCDTVQLIPQVTAADGTALSGESVRLGLKWAVDQDTQLSGFAYHYTKEEALSGAQTGLTAIRVGRLGQGDHSVTASLVDGGAKAPSAAVKIKGRPPRPDLFEIQPRSAKVRKGARLNFQGRITFKDECVEERELEKADIEWKADRGSFENDVYVASEAGVVRITGRYTIKGPGGATVVDIAQLEVIDGALKASVGASITRKAPK